MNIHSGRWAKQGTSRPHSVYCARIDMGFTLENGWKSKIMRVLIENKFVNLNANQKQHCATGAFLFCLG